MFIYSDSARLISFKIRLISCTRFNVYAQQACHSRGKIDHCLKVYIYEHSCHNIFTVIQRIFIEI